MSPGNTTDGLPSLFRYTSMCDLIAPGSVRVPACPVRVILANGRRRPRVGIEPQHDHGRRIDLLRCAIRRGRHRVSPKQRHGRTCPSGAIMAGPRDDGDRHLLRDSAPSLPAVKLRQIVRTHQPHELDFRKPAGKRPQRIDCVSRPQLALDRRDADRSALCLLGRGKHAGLERRHTTAGFQRIAWRDQPPDLGKSQRLLGKKRNSTVPAMRRIEAAAQ